MFYNSYGKRPLWQWIVIYIIVGGIVYALIYYFFFAGRGGYSFKPTPAPETPESSIEQDMQAEFYLQVAESLTLGEYLTAWNGMTLYVSNDDETDLSKCVGACAVNWPPYIVPATDVLKIKDGISGQTAVITRDDGSLQVTYNSMPLYFWRNDQNPGDTTGHGIGDFSVAKP